MQDAATRSTPHYCFNQDALVKSLLRPRPSVGVQTISSILLPLCLLPLIVRRVGPCDVRHRRRGRTDGRTTEMPTAAARAGGPSPPQPRSISLPASEESEEDTSLFPYGFLTCPLDSEAAAAAANGRGNGRPTAARRKILYLVGRTIRLSESPITLAGATG